MASDGEACAFALEGVYAALHRLGLPFSLSGELQTRKLTLQQSVWTVKLTKSGISVSLYWPCLNNKRKKKKKNASRQVELDPELNDTKPTEPVVSQSQHQVQCRHSAVDLISCPSVQYEEKDGISGVTYTTKSGLTDWTPVRQVRRGRTRRTSHSSDSPHNSNHSETDSETESLMDIPPSSSVRYSVRDGQPGLFLATPRIRTWTPIAARTRLKTTQY